MKWGEKGGEKGINLKLLMALCHFKLQSVNILGYLPNWSRFLCQIDVLLSRGPMFPRHFTLLPTTTKNSQFSQLSHCFCLENQRITEKLLKLEKNVSSLAHYYFSYPLTLLQKCQCVWTFDIAQCLSHAFSVLLFQFICSLLQDTESQVG